MNKPIIGGLSLVGLIIFSPVLYWLMRWWSGIWLPSSGIDPSAFIITVFLTVWGVGFLGLYPLIIGKYPWE